MRFQQHEHIVGERRENVRDPFELGEVGIARNPAFLTAAIDRWIEDVRPILRRVCRDADHGAMRLDRRGETIGKAQIARAVRRTIGDRTGIPVSTHVFRRSVATQAAISDPKHAVEIGRALLAHASASSTEIYDLARGFEAQEVWLEMLGRKRDEDKDARLDATTETFIEGRLSTGSDTEQ